MRQCYPSGIGGGRNVFFDGGCMLTFGVISWWFDTLHCVALGNCAESLLFHRVSAERKHSSNYRVISNISRSG
jgi:hypothetical protein